MPEIIQDQDPKNSAIANRLQDDQKEVPQEMGRSLNDLAPGGYTVVQNNEGELETIIPHKKDIVSKETNSTEASIQQVPQPKATRAKKATVVKPQGKVDAASAIEKLQEGIEKARKQMELIQLIDSSINPIAISAELPKGPRDLLLDYTKEIEAVKGKYIQHIQSL